MKIFLVFKPREIGATDSSQLWSIVIARNWSRAKEAAVSIHASATVFEIGEAGHNMKEGELLTVADFVLDGENWKVDMDLLNNLGRSKVRGDPYPPPAQQLLNFGKEDT